MSKVDRITYNKTFVIGPYMNEKIGVEMQVDSDSEDIYEAFEYAKRIVEGFHKASSPHIGEPITYSQGSEGRGEFVNALDNFKPTPPPEKDYKAIQRLEILIDDAKVLYDLQILQGQVAKYGLQDAYDKKMDELTKVIGI